VRLTRKIAVLVAVPLAAMLVFAGLAIWVAVVDVQRADRLTSLVTLGQRSADLAEALQAERAAAVSLLIGPGPEMTRRTEAFAAAVAATDAAVAGFQSALSSARVPGAAWASLERLSTQLGLLSGVRDRVRSGTAAASAVAFRYRIIIASTVDYREVVAQAGQAPAEIAELLRFSVNPSRAAEALGLQQVAVLRALDAGVLSPAAVAEVTATRTAFVEAEVAFGSAPAEWQAWWSSATTGAEVLAASQMQDRVLRAGSGEPLGIDAAAWSAGLAHRIGLIHEVEARADEAVLAAVGDLRADAVRRTGFVSTGVLLVVVAAVALAVGLGRPVIVDLRRLRDGARAVAYERLPQLVARLGQATDLREVDPHRAASLAPATGVRGRNEVGEVGLAFDEVYREAVRAAAELARSRLGLSQMFVALGRRVQRRSGQMTRELDLAEKNETDPDRLKFLYRIDLLTTLVRRTADELLVLGGYGPGDARPGSMPMHDVLRGACSRIEKYQQVHVGLVDDDLTVSGHVANDLILLLAELLDNAANFSQDEVVVNVSRLADRLVVQVIDTGIGLREERRQQLNERLRHPVVDVDAVSQMGLTVAGVLATHHGWQVELRPNQPRGVIAEVSIPATVTRTAATAAIGGRGHAPARHRARTPAMLAPRPRTPVSDGQVGAWGAATQELPIVADLAASGRDGPWAAGHRTTAGGLPVRQPQANRFPAASQVLPQWVPQRDPGQVAAAVAAHLRGISRAQRQSHS